MSDAFRHILMIAYYFPPLGLSGVQRTTKFAKFLSRYGWKPTVLTVEPAGYYAFDDSLLQEVKEAGVEIVRTSSIDAQRLFRKRGVVKLPSERLRKFATFVGDSLFIPDTKIGWKKRALTAAMKLVQEKHFDALFATAPPQTDFLIGAELKRRTGIPLVLDYRDAWLEYPFKYFPTPLHTYLHKKLERSVLHEADHVVVTHRRIKERLLRRHSRLSYHDVTIISQGYDAEDFDRPIARRQPGIVLRIVHAGTFYGRRSPEVLLKALRSVTTSRPELRSRFEVHFIGAKREQDGKLVHKLGLEDLVTFHGYLEHRACIRLMQGADVLWYVNDNDMSSPGKLYEYFAADKPIFASVVDGYTRQQIQESGASIIVGLNDVRAHEEGLMDLLTRQEQKSLPAPPKNFVERFDRFRLTGDLAKVFESLMNYDRPEEIKVRESVA